VVDRRRVDVGETILPGQVLVTIPVLDRVRVVSFVDNRDMSFVDTGASSTPTRPRPEVPYTASIESVGMVADPRTGNFPIKPTLSNHDGLLCLGVSVY